MTTAEKRQAYQNFFKKNEAGKYFLTKLNDIITSNHDKAEAEPTMARDYAQRAKGIREVIDHINSLTAERSILKR